MRKTFLVWLFVFMTTAFGAALTISFYVQTNQATDNAKTLILVKIDDVEKQLQKNLDNLKEIRAESDTNGLAKAHAFAEMLLLNPSIASDGEALEKIRLLLNVDELHISNAKGILVGGTVKSYIGYDYASDPQSAAFLPAITDRNFELAQDPQPKGINKEIFQYVGVARQDEPGIVQIGLKPEKLEHAMEVADIKNLAGGFRVGQSGSILIADQEGKIVSIADTQYLGRTLAEYGLPESNFNNDEGSFITDVSGTKELCAYKKYNSYLIIGQLSGNEMYLSRNNAVLILILFNILLFAVIFVLIAKLVQFVVIDGIHTVNGSLAKITAGDLNEVVDVGTNEEFRSLSRGINATVNALKEAIKEASARIDSELAFAQAIQLSALPSSYPAFPERSDFDIYAGMITAKEVGGDFYDYFMLSDDQLGFVIADVSGKGIPAALFMMVAKSLIKHYALTEISAGATLFKANNALCENNEANMFVTVFFGVLDLRTGRLNYANAGHNPPLWRRKASGLYEWLPVKRSLVLAGMENVCYAEQEVQLQQGDRLFLYTDGVTEAMNTEQALYSDQHLIEFLNNLTAEEELGTVVTRVKEDIERFADGAEQADDITMLVLEYHGKAENRGK